MKITTLFIFTLISVLVFGSAGYIMYTSLSAPDSNLHFAVQLAGEVMDATSLNTKEGSALAPSPTPVPEVAGVQSQACDPDLEFMKTQISIVNYLKQNGFEGNFSARYQLAAEYGIQDYKGNAADNLLLVRRVQEDMAVKNNCIL